MNYLVSSESTVRGVGPGPIVVEEIDGLQTLEKAYETIELERPDIIKVCYPRRYPGVHGYPSPKFFVTSAFAHVCNVADPARAHDKTAMYSFCTSVKLIGLGVPTYFVGKELAESLAMTTPPEDMLLDELVWPLDGMMFVVPLEFSRKFFGVDVLHISIVRVKAGEKLDCPFPTGLQWEPYIGSPNSDALIMSASAIEKVGGKGAVATYHGVVPLGAGKRLSDIMAAADTGRFEYFGCVEDPKQQEEGAQVKKLISCALNYMLVMTEVPEWVEAQVQTRKEKLKKGKVRDALWSPNFIGRTYCHPKSPPQGGTHASPRVHWRKGHWHTFLHGQGRTLKKRKLIAAILVNADAHA